MAPADHSLEVKDLVARRHHLHGDIYKDKLTVAHGAVLGDPAGLFNANPAGGTRRAIDPCESEKVDHAPLTALIREAVALTISRASRPRKGQTSPRRRDHRNAPP